MIRENETHARLAERLSHILEEFKGVCGSFEENHGFYFFVPR